MSSTFKTKAISVAGIIEPTLQTAEIRRSADRPTNDLTAYDLYLRAYAMFFSSGKANHPERQIPEAIRLLEQAIEREPGYGPALGLAAVCSLRLASDGGSEDLEIDNRKGADFARRALQVAGDDPGIDAAQRKLIAEFVR